MVSPDRLSERLVEKYILYIRDALGVARETFAPLFFGLKFFYLQTLGYDCYLPTILRRIAWSKRLLASASQCKKPYLLSVGLTNALRRIEPGASHLRFIRCIRENPRKALDPREERDLVEKIASRASRYLFRRFVANSPARK
jgi:hypothetical protein